MFGSISNWISSNLQLLTEHNKPEEKQEKSTEDGNNSTATTASNPAELAKTEDIDKIEKVESNNANEQQNQDVSAAAATGNEETSSNTKIFDSIKNDFNKILSIDKQEALDEAKEIGNLFLSFGKSATQPLFSFGKTATKQISETATHLKDVIEKNTLIGDFSKENEKFVNEKKMQQRREEAAVPPWVGYADEETLKEQITSLSADSRNFLRNPPAGVEFNFDFTQSYPIALATLEEDAKLKEMRFSLVPKKVSEETFWRNYFYRVSLIKQSTQINQLVSKNDLTESKSTSVDSDISNANSDSSIGKKNSKSEIDVAVNEGNVQNNEFVSDSYEDQINEEEIKLEMKQLKLDNNNKNTNISTDETEEQDWDKDLEEDIDNITAEELEKEISQMIGSDSK